MITLAWTVVILLETGMISGENGGDPLDSLKWLSGCWVREGKDGLVAEEQWTNPSGGTMLGMSRTVKDGRTTQYEFLRIVADSSGGLSYVALPSGQSEASFWLIRSDGNEFVFENPAHDFPQRVIYRRLGPDSLIASIEGMMGGKERSIPFPMRRAECVPR
jgi:hypothetical protein